MDSEKLPVKSGREIVATLGRLGFAVVRISKHYIMKKGTVVVPVPYHKTVPRGTIRAIIREAKVSVKEFVENDP